MLDFLAFLGDLLLLGDSFVSLRRISDGDAQERASVLYDTPEMRRCRAVARLVLLLYLVAIIVLPIAAVIWIEASFWRQVYIGQYAVLAIVIYIAAVCFGFWALKRIFRRQREAIAAQQSV
jgi:hypothetical protein